MKRYMSAVVAVMVGLAMVGVWGCGGSDDNDNGGGGGGGGGTGGGIVGTWTLQSATVQGQTVSADQMGISWTMTFAANGTVSMTANGQSASGSYVASGGSLTIDGQYFASYSVSGNTLALTMTSQGVTGTFNFARS